MAERGLEPAPAAVAALPPDVRAQLAELELELSEGRSRAGERAPGRRCGSRREGDQVPAARPGGRAGEREGGCRKSGPGSEGSSSLLSHPVEWLSRVGSLCPLGGGQAGAWGRERASPGPGCFCAPCPPKRETKLRPPLLPGRLGTVGVGVRLRAGWLTAFSCPLPFSREGPTPVSVPLTPSKKEKDT